MKLKKRLPLVLILTVCCMHTKAAADSLPPCLKEITTVALKSYTEYEYKGKRLFSFTTVTNHSDSMVSIHYYDSSCRLFCTWVRRGIMGSKMQPYTIEKAKIITLKTIHFSTVSDIKTNTGNTLPDSIIKIALLKNSQWIEENHYDDHLVYRLQNSGKKAPGSQIIFTNPYFDENGKVTTPKKMTRRTFWWYKDGEKFVRTQFRPGYR